MASRSVLVSFLCIVCITQVGRSFAGICDNCQNYKSCSSSSKTGTYHCVCKDGFVGKDCESKSIVLSGAVEFKLTTPEKEQLPPCGIVLIVLGVLAFLGGVSKCYFSYRKKMAKIQKQKEIDSHA